LGRPGVEYFIGFEETTIWDICPKFYELSKLIGDCYLLTKTLKYIIIVKKSVFLIVSKMTLILGPRQAFALHPKTINLIIKILIYN
jgi:hypothetical protein